MIVALTHHWQLALAAAAFGLALGVGFVAVYYLAVPVQLRLAANPEVRAYVLERELARLRRLGDAAAVYEEQGRSSEAGELRAEIEFRARLLAWAALGLVISG